HFKDCQSELAKESREDGWDYFESVRRGIFCELGKGTVDFAGLTRELVDRGYGGWIVVEQDVLPGMGTPLESAIRNRSFLESIGI
ncbi:MAG: xylose isomerase, partial [Cyanobacteria bacterium SZAS LIN-5]|nr:xylose isomerase [Cyanobacteria bacterium SZAS LIN-5]